jgi:low temperature requirement protein LtrA
MIIVFTATWYAVTAYINRFFSEDLKHQAFYFLQTFCVIVCAKSSNPDLSQAARFSIMLAISRAGLVLMYIYIGVVYHEELTQLRSMYVKQYVFAVAMYIAAALAFSSDTVGGVSGDTVGVVLWVVQVICDWQAAMWLGPPGYACVRHTPIPLFDVEHMSKRLAEYTMLILGESVISLCFANDEKASEELKIFGLFLAVSIVFFMRLLYFDQIPHDRNKHAFKYSVVCGRLFNFSHWPLAGGLLLAGVGFKKVLSKISYEYVPTPYANLLSISLALSLTTINFISNTHTGFFGCMATDDFLGESTATPRMKALLALRIVLILITGTQSLWASSFSPWMYITCHSVVVFILWCIDLYEDLHLHNAGHRVQNEMEGGAGAFFPEADDDVEGGAAGGDPSGPEKGAGNGAALDVEEVHSPQLSPRLEPLSNGDKEGKGEHAVADKPLP